MKKCFFSVNKGLERRFQWIHKIDSYTGSQLVEILLRKLHKDRWKFQLELTFIVKEIDKHIGLFKNMGGDIEKFITNLKLIHAKRIFSLDHHHRKVLNKDDFNNAIELMKTGQLSEQKVNTANHLYI